MNNKFLILIFLIALFLRLFNLSNVPPGLNTDESSYAYNAYSILKTGKDEWGNRLPLVIESFGDHKPPMNAYVVLPSIYVLGLNNYAVRFPFAALNSLSVVAMYLLVKALFRDDFGSKSLVNKLALTASFLLAVSPWYLMLSRGAFESGLQNFFVISGMAFIFNGNKKSWRSIVGSALLGFSMFTYHSAKIIAPLLFIGYLVLNNKIKVNLKNKPAQLSVVIFSILSLIMLVTFFQGGNTRARQLNIYQGTLMEAASRRVPMVQEGVDPRLIRIFINKFEITAERFFNNYMSYFSPEFLFINGTDQGSYGVVPGIGLMYVFETITLAIGVMVAFRKIHKKPFQFILLWLFIAPIPAAVTMGGAFTAHRSSLMIAPLSMISALGFIKIIEIFNVKLEKRAMIGNILVLGVVLYYVSSFLLFYFAESKYVLTKSMHGRNFEAASWVIENKNEDQKVYFSTSISMPHIYVALVEKWDPKDYQNNSKNWKYKEEHNRDWVDHIPEYYLGDYVFGDSVEWRHIYSNAGDLFVAQPGDFPPEVSDKIIKTFYYPDNSEALHVLAI